MCVSAPLQGSDTGSAALAAPVAAEKPKPKPPTVELPKPPAVELPKPPVSLPKPGEVKEAAEDAVQAAKDAAPASVQDAALQAAKGAADAPSANPFSFFGGASLTRACMRITRSSPAHALRASA